MEEDQEWLGRIAVERAGSGEDHRSIWTSLNKSKPWFSASGLSRKTRLHATPPGFFMV